MLLDATLAWVGWNVLGPLALFALLSIAVLIFVAGGEAVRWVKRKFGKPHNSHGTEQ